jgi:hypothetical protein
VEGSIHVLGLSYYTDTCLERLTETKQKTEVAGVRIDISTPGVSNVWHEYQPVDIITEGYSQLQQHPNNRYRMKATGSHRSIGNEKHQSEDRLRRISYFKSCFILVWKQPKCN